MKLFAFDIDNTLLPQGQNKLPPKEILAVNELLAQGNAVSIASGRNFTGIKQYLDCFNTGQKFAIAANGSGVYSFNRELLFKRTLTLKDLDYFSKKFQDHNEVSVYGYTVNDGVIYYRPSFWTENEYRCNKMKEKIDLNVVKDESSDYPLFKVMLASSPEDSLKLQFTESEKNEYSFIRSAPPFIEVMRKGTDKKVGVSFLADFLNIDHDNVYCFGDEGNDAGMIEEFHGIALGNAVPECKKKAEIVTKTCLEDGVYYALKDILHFID
jgi:Cof subfamily protein (haloacid dehalogenase superfamily)